MKFLVFFLFVSTCVADEFLSENPSSLFDEEGKATGLENQVGKAVITTKELEAKQAEENRLAELNEAKRAKEEERIARIAERKAGDPTPPSECIGYTGVKSHKIVRGDTLGKMASDIYNNSAYSTWISVYNNKPANKLFLGETLKTPSLYEVFTELEGKAVWEKYPYAIRDLLLVHEQMKKLEPIIIAEKSAGKYSDDTKKQLDEMIWTLGQVKQDFLDKVEGVNEYPLATMSQLQTVVNNVKLIRRGDLGKGNRNFQRVSLYMINCYSYALAWGRDGFSSKK